MADAAANLMWCTTMALNGLIAAGVPEDWTTHMIGHELTALHGIDHARTLAIVLPGVMKVMLESKKLKVIQYATKVWGIENQSEDETIALAIQRLKPSLIGQEAWDLHCHASVSGFGIVLVEVHLQRP